MEPLVSINRQLASSAFAIQAEVLEFLYREKHAGRRIVLATASDSEADDQIARHLGIFGELIASDGKVNLSGQNKCEVLKERFCAREFDYIGNGFEDVIVWKSANTALLVNPSKRPLVNPSKRPLKNQ